MSSLRSEKCRNCGEKMPRGKLRCPKCKHWQTGTVHNELGDGSILLSDVVSTATDRLETGPWDKCWGTSYSSQKSGIARSSTTLIGGSPGAGKSTLLLQISDAATEVTGREAMYIAVEEPVEQIKDRADRLQIKWPGRIRMVQLLSGEGAIPDLLERYRPSLFVLDSVSALANGNAETAIHVCKVIKGFSMQYRAPGLIVSHVIKGGDLAGVMALQHEVDTTMTFFPDGDPGDGGEPLRIMEVLKNRNGAIVSMHFRMTERGLVAVEEDSENAEG